jgi:hypothetical protein
MRLRNYAQGVFLAIGDVNAHMAGDLAGTGRALKQMAALPAYTTSYLPD